jgi:hypothetical protein
MPCHDGRSYSSPHHASLHTSGLRIRSKRPSLRHSMSASATLRSCPVSTHQNLSVLSPQRSCPTSCQSSMARIESEGTSHMCSSLEYEGLMSWAFTVCECANCLSGLVFEASQELVKLPHTKCLEKPFAAAMKSTRARAGCIVVGHTHKDQVAR